MMGNVDAFLARLKGFKALIDAGQVPQKSVDACRSYLVLEHFNKARCNASSMLAALQLMTATVVSQSSPSLLANSWSLPATMAAGGDEQEVCCRRWAVLVCHQ